MTTPHGESLPPIPGPELGPGLPPNVLPEGVDPAFLAAAMAGNLQRQPQDEPLGPSAEALENEHEREPEERVGAKLIECAGWALRNNSGRLVFDGLKTPSVAALAFHRNRPPASATKMAYDPQAREVALQLAMDNPDDADAIQSLFMLSLHPDNPGSDDFNHYLMNELGKHGMFTKESVEGYMNPDLPPERRRLYQLVMPENPYKGSPDAQIKVRKAIGNLGRVTPQEEFVNALLTPSARTPEARYTPPSFKETMSTYANEVAARAHNQHRSRWGSVALRPLMRRPEKVHGLAAVEPRLYQMTDEELRDGIIAGLPAAFVGEHVRGNTEGMTAATADVLKKDRLVDLAGWRDMSLAEFMQAISVAPEMAKPGMSMTVLNEMMKRQDYYLAQRQSDGLLAYADALSADTNYSNNRRELSGPRMFTAIEIYGFLQREVANRVARQQQEEERR